MSDWRIVAASAPGAERLIDEKNRTDWVAPLTGAADAPCFVTIDLGRTREIGGFVLKPAWHAPQGGRSGRLDRPDRGRPALAGAPIDQGEFSNIAVNQAVQRLLFATPRRGRYLRIDFTRTVLGETRVAVAELGLVTRASA